MPKFAAPWPYNFELNGVPYLYPPPRVMQILDSSAFTRDSLEWFPQRTQQSAVSESLYPPDAEASHTVVDRTGGFGYSEVPHEGGNDSNETPDNVYAYVDAVDGGSSGDGQGVDCSVEGIAFLAPKINPITLAGGGTEMRADFELTVGGTRYQFVVAGTKMFRSSDGTTFSAVQASGADLPAALTGRPIVYQGAQTNPQVYFPMGSGQTFRTWDGNTANAFGSPTVTDKNKWIDCVLIDEVAYVLWLDSATHEYRVSSFDDGIAVASSGTIPAYTPYVVVSDASDAARSLLVAHDVLYVGCDRTLKALDAERNTLEKTIWRTSAPGANNFRWWTQWRDELWFTADQGTYRLKPGGSGVVFESIGPETLPNNRTPVRGIIRAMVGDDYCLYGFLRTEAGVTYLLKYRYYDKGRRAAWHVISRVGTYDVNHAFVSTIQGTNPRLYFGTSATEMRYFVLPRNGVYPPSDPNCEYTDKGYVFDTRMHGGLYSVNKSLFGLTVRVQDTSSTETVTSYYQTNAVSAFTQFGSSPIEADPGTRWQLTDPEVAVWWEGRHKLVRGTTVTVSPKILSTTYAFLQRPVAKGSYTIFAWAADGAKNRAGGEDKRSARDIVTVLENLDSGATPVDFVDSLGRTKAVFVNKIRYTDFSQEADEEPQFVVRISFVEYASRGAGTWNIVGNYTWEQLAAYTWEQVSQLIG